MKNSILEASCRVAFAAMVHDLGKFYQRTKSASLKDIDKQLYCPFRNEHFTHEHAAYTALAIDELASYFLPLRGDNVEPFKKSTDRDIDDSLINAAAKHHNPQTDLQKIISEADRLSSAFERKDYETYRFSADSDNYISSRLICPFEVLDREAIQPDLQYIYSLKPLSAEALLPQKKTPLSPNEAAKEYADLWQSFEKALEILPPCTKNLNVWLDNFDTLWLTYTQAVPSASAFKTGSIVNKTMASVSLYDHSKSTAALATALWRHKYETEHNGPAEAGETDSPFLIIQGDMSGIQDFIFAQGSETQRKAAQILRGRSFLISLISECAALKILDTLDLPSTSQIINAAGHFTIVAPNTRAVREKLSGIKNEMEGWFYKELYATVNIVLAWKEASKSDFTSQKFPDLMRDLYGNLGKAKRSQMNLCEGKYNPVFSHFPAESCLVCENDGRFPVADSQNGSGLCAFCEDIERIGRDLTSKNYLIIGDKLENPLKTKIFGYNVALSDILPSATTLNDPDRIKRVWDISLPSGDQVLFNGVARRNINAYVPRENGTLLTFEELAGKALSNGRGTAALMTFKGDIDNLGLLFQKRLTHKTFASYAALSRQINNFFTLVVPVLCQKDNKFVYTIFAGGDDFFFITPWDEQISFMNRVKEYFDKYVCNNVTFSAGLVMMHSKLPVRIAAELTEDCLDQAKKLPNKNGVCLFDKAVDFAVFKELTACAECLLKNREEYALSTGFVYRLITLCQMAGDAKNNPRNTIWRSWLRYRITRHCEENKDLKSKKEKLTEFLGENLEKHGENFQIPLFICLYKLRTKE